MIIIKEKSLCRCLIREKEEDGIVGAIKFCLRTKQHYTDNKECWIKAGQDPVWQFRIPTNNS